jgi:hypothetical protein
MNETLAVEFTSVDAPSGLARAEHSFDGEELLIALERA